MANREPFRDFRDLTVHRVGLDIAEAVYRLTGTYPAEERFGLSAQMRRAAVSIPSNIAEGWGRGEGADNVRFVRIARGSLCELTTQLMLAERLGYPVDPQLNESLERESRLIQAYLTSMQRNLVREERATYDPTVRDLPFANSEE
ncbi:four helix bundle protein [soil metagenome]